MSQPPDVPGPYGPGATPPDPDGVQPPPWAMPSPGTPADAAPPGPPSGPPFGPPSGPPSGPPPGYGPPQGYVPPPGYAPGAVPGTKPKRFSGGHVVLGVLACWAIMLVPGSLAVGLLNALDGADGGAVALAVGGLSLLAPLVVGAVLVGRGSPQRRGLGLGLFVGWGLFVVIGGGACIALIAALGSSGG